MRDLPIDACLSVCPSHAGTDSKLMTVGHCGFHRRVAGDSFLKPNFVYHRSQGTPLSKTSNMTGEVKRQKRKVSINKSLYL